MPLRRLAEQVGRTPFYAYDRGLIAQRAEQLRQALPANIGLHYCLKANPMPALVGFLAGLVDGLDVASGGELKLALDAGMAARHISFAGPGKLETELRQSMAAGILVNVESRREINLLAALCEQTGWPARVAIRVNPDFELKSSGMKMGGGAKPFGIDAEEVPQALRDIQSHGLAFEGFHVYAGSQSLDAEALAHAQRQSWELVLRLAAQSPSPVLSVNLGGGFGLPYFPGDRPLALEPIAEALALISEQAARHLSPAAQLAVELGRYLVGDAGIYVTRVIDKKVSRGRTFLVTDGGLNHHLAASGNFGQVIRKDYPVAIGTRMGLPASAAAPSVVGPLCTPLDILSERTALPDAEPGDLVVVFQSGAYGASASPQDFLSHPRALEVLV